MCGLGYSRGPLMQLCYVDESGTAELLTRADGQQQPVVVIAGVTLPEVHLASITQEWIDVKTRFYPALATRGHGWMDAILADVKGAKLRSGFRDGATGRRRKQAIGFVDHTIRLLERAGGRVIGRVWIKELDKSADDMAIHSSSLQFISSAFDASLPDGERGMVVVDSQTYQHNHRLAHTMFTGRFSKSPRYTNLGDIPVFGHSDNHAGLQIADILCSTVLAPVGCAVYASSYSGWNQHCHSSFLDIRDRFGERIERLTFEWSNPKTGKPTSSVIVSDPLGKRPSRLLWGPSASARATPRRRRAGGGTSSRARSA